MTFRTPPELVELWGDFIGPYEQRVETCGKHVEAIVRRLRCKTVLDNAAGTGYEVQYLDEQGIPIDVNEIDDSFRKKSEERFKGTSVRVFDSDWREMAYTIPKGYDLEMCLGNNLTYLHDREEQLKALQNMRAVLNNPGALLIDHRNYDKILELVEEDPGFTSRPLDNHNIYTGDLVTVTPRIVTPENVRLHYQHTEKPIEEYLNLYPFGFKEFRELLREVGFETVESFANWEPITDLEDFNPLTLDENTFFQHLAHK
ncbi:class I SAM-dependent methyltransferase [Candidatus Woesearchaeota archaeon]|nr:class I SAM-dependent methyltransferase [Candidatus Woesearchaeota archaeon]